MKDRLCHNGAEAIFVFTQKLPASAVRRQAQPRRMQTLHPPPTESSARQSGRMEIFTMRPIPNFAPMSAWATPTLLKSFLAGDVNANQRTANLSPEEQ